MLGGGQEGSGGGGVDPDHGAGLSLCQNTGMQRRPADGGTLQPPHHNYCNRQSELTLMGMGSTELWHFLDFNVP